MFAPPARLIHSVLADYVRVSMDHMPYAFFAATKTVSYAVTNVSTAPMSTVRLNAFDGNKFYRKVRILLVSNGTRKINHYKK